MGKRQIVLRISIEAWMDDEDECYPPETAVVNVMQVQLPAMDKKYIILPKPVEGMVDTALDQLKASVATWRAKRDDEAQLELWNNGNKVEDAEGGDGEAAEVVGETTMNGEEWGEDALVVEGAETEGEEAAQAEAEGELAAVGPRLESDELVAMDADQ